MAVELWIDLISEGEGSHPYISYIAVTLPDLRQISHSVQLFAITKGGIHYKRFFLSCFNIISYCSCKNWQHEEHFKSYRAAKGIFLFFFFFSPPPQSLNKLSNCEIKLSVIVHWPLLGEKMVGFWSTLYWAWFVNMSFWKAAQCLIMNISAVTHFMLL